jgi:lipopolysaccharide export system protein LptA
MRFGALFALLLIATASAQAAPAANPIAANPISGRHDANQPIYFSADRFVAEKEQSGAAGTINGTYIGNVVITQGEMRLRANTVRIAIIGGKPNKIYANGAVVVNSTSGTATGDNGVYDVTPRLITLTGHVVLTKEKNVMRGQMLTVNLVTGVANLGGGGGVSGTQGGGRVQGVFAPPPQSAGGTK